MEPALIITISLMTVIAAVTAGLWARNRSAKPLVAGIGLMLIPLGLYLTGLMRLAYNGVMSLVAWAQRTVWDQVMTWGAALLGVGLLLLVVSGFLKSKPRVAAPTERAAAPGSPSRPAVTARPGATAAAPSTPAAGAAPAAKGKPAVDPEDAEIEALLRKRGIM